MIVKDWVDQGVYPYEGDADSAVKTAERQMFDVVAVTAAQAVNSGERPAQRLSLRLLREALESNPANLHQVLQGVLELPQDRLDELSNPYPQAVVAFDLGESVGKDTPPCALC